MNLLYLTCHTIRRELISTSKPEAVFKTRASHQQRAVKHQLSLRGGGWLKVALQPCNNVATVIY